MNSLRVQIRLVAVGLTASCALLASSHPPLAQNEANVPGELVRAILARPGEDPVVLAGVAPEVVTTTVRLPRDWRILGSVLFSSSSSVYVQARGTAETIRALLQQQLLDEGWSAPESIRRGGFVPSEVTSPAAFCGPDGQLMTLWTSEQPEGPLLRIAVQERPMATPCDRAHVRTSSLSELNDRMPILSIPEGQVRSTGMGGSGQDSAYSGIELETTLAPVEIADRVSTDLAASGWVLHASTVSDVSLVRTWTREFEGGFRAHGQLLIITIGAGKYDVAFQMTKISER